MAAGEERLVIKVDMPMYRSFTIRRKHRTCIMSIGKRSINFSQYNEKTGECEGPVFNIGVNEIESIENLGEKLRLHYRSLDGMEYIEVSNCDPGQKGCTIDIRRFEEWLRGLRRERDVEVSRLMGEKLDRRDLVKPKSEERTRPYSTEVFFNPKTGDELLSTLRARLALEDMERLKEIERKSKVDELSERLRGLRGGKKRLKSRQKRRSLKRRV